MNRLRILHSALCILHFFAAASLPAGEPIIVPSNKAKTGGPVDTSPAATREIFRLRQQSAPFDALNIPSVVRPSDSDPIIEDKRHRLKRLERQNWMTVSQGELQEEEEAKTLLGVRDYSLDDIDKDHDRENLMFRRSKKDDEEKDNDRRTPGQSRSARDKDKDKDKARHPKLRREQQDDLDLDKFRDGDLRDSPDLANELPTKATVKTTLRSLFAPQQPEQTGDSLAPKFNKSDLALPGMLQSTVDPATVREQEAKREEFLKYLNRNTAPATGSLDPINTRNDLTRQPMNPTTPQQPFAAPGPASGNPFGPPADVKSSPLSANLPVLAPRAPVAFSDGPFAAPQSQTRSLQSQQPMAFEVPKRKF